MENERWRTELLVLDSCHLGVSLPWHCKNLQWRNTLSQKLEVGERHSFAYCDTITTAGKSGGVDKLQPAGHILVSSNHYHCSGVDKLQPAGHILASSNHYHCSGVDKLQPAGHRSNHAACKHSLTALFVSMIKAKFHFASRSTD